MTNAVAVTPDAAALVDSLTQQFRDRKVPALIPGSLLAQMVDVALGHSFKRCFDPGERPQLRAFVQKFLPSHLVQVTDERQGSDFLYVIPGEASTVGRTRDGTLWKSFAAMQGISRLVYDKETGAVSVVGNSLPTPQACQPIEGLKSEEVRVICENFITQLEEKQEVNVTPLKVILEQRTQNGNFYQTWLTQLRLMRPLDRQWGQFRHDRLLELYEQRLLDIKVPKPRAKQLRYELSLDHDAARKPGRVAVAHIAAEAMAKGSAASESQAANEAKARALLRTAADHLSYEELLAVKLPLSVILKITSSSQS